MEDKEKIILDTYREIKRLYQNYFDRGNSIRKAVTYDRQEMDDISYSLKKLVKDLEETIKQD